MMRLIHGTAKFGDAARHSRGRLVVNDENSFNAPIAVRRQARFQLRGGRALAPVARHVINLNAKSFRNLAPELRKMSRLEQQYSIPRRESVDNRRFPSASPRGWI